MNKITKTIISILCAITLLSLPIIVAHAEDVQVQEDSPDDFLVDPTSGYAVHSQDIDNGDVNNEDNGNENDATSQDTQIDNGNNNVDNSNPDNTNNVGNGQNEVVEVSDTGSAVTSPEAVTQPDNTATAPTSDTGNAPPSDVAPASSSDAGVSAPSSDSGSTSSGAGVSAPSSDSGGSTASAEQAQFSNTITMPGSPIYRLKLWWESAQEKFTSDNVKLLILKQQHLQNRINELKYDANYNNNKNADSLLQKIQISRIEVDDILQKIRTNYQGGYIVQKVKGMQVLTKTEDYIAKAQRINDKILTNILNDPILSKNARKNLKDAVIKIGLMKKVKANMVQSKSGVSISASPKGATLPSVAPKGATVSSVAASKKITTKGTVGKAVSAARKKIKAYRMKAYMVQGTYQASDSTLRYIPFKTALLYVPSEVKWYGITINPGGITIGDAAIRNPEFYLYPTQPQVEDIKQLAMKVNTQAALTTSDKISLIKLWVTMQKKGAS